jgi:hypothetical protein
MKFDLGIAAAVVGALVFYTRLTWVQRRSARAKSSSGAGGVSPIVNWLFFSLGVALVCAGAFFAAFRPSPLLETCWWIPVTLGFGVLCFSV